MHDEELLALLREDFTTFIQACFEQVSPGSAFVYGPHLDLIADRLDRVRRGEIKRLIINIPPRNLKSISASVALPAFILGHDPKKEIICASYAQDLADKHAFDCLAVMRSKCYQKIFPTRIAGRKARNDFTTTKGGGRMATSVGGVLTGRGADIIIIDDPLKPEQALSELSRTAVNRWLDNTLLSRLNDKESGAIIIIMQRLHADDLTGHVLEQGGWEILSLPAIAEEDEAYEYKMIGERKTFTRKKGEALHPEREPLETLLKLKATLGEYNFAGQYQQRPAPEGGGLVKAEWFSRYDYVPSHFDLTIHSWDTASKQTELADYSVGTVWGVLDDKMYLLNIFREKLDYPRLKHAVKSYSMSYNPDVILIEDKASGTQLIQELKYDGMWNVKGITPTGDKIMRLHAQTARIEAGLVLLPQEALWLEEYLKEITTFPYGKHDDQVDSTAQALQYMVMEQPLNAPITSHLFRL
jgi:predicted phage terminase large subunit-like protein